MSFETVNFRCPQQRAKQKNAGARRLKKERRTNETNTTTTSDLFNRTRCPHGRPGSTHDYGSTSKSDQCGREHHDSFGRGHWRTAALLPMALARQYEQLHQHPLRHRSHARAHQCSTDQSPICRRGHRLGWIVGNQQPTGFSYRPARARHHAGSRTTAPRSSASGTPCACRSL